MSEWAAIKYTNVEIYPSPHSGLSKKSVADCLQITIEAGTKNNSENALCHYNKALANAANVIAFICVIGGHLFREVEMAMPRLSRNTSGVSHLNPFIKMAFDTFIKAPHCKILWEQGLD